jgi:uncharacterized protein (TIGR01244 family)
MPLVRNTRLAPLGTIAAALLLVAHPASAQFTRSVSLPMPGIDTFHPVTPTIACGSDARPEAMAALAKAGFVAVISFREDGEPGYDRAAAERAAVEAGIRYLNIPFNREQPDPAAARRFLEVIAAADHTPAFLSCSTGQRTATMWLIKRVAQDGWPLERAMAEAEALGLTRPELKRFAQEFLATHAR